MSGAVTAVDATSFTVDGDTTVTVAVDDATTFTATETADTSAIATGMCVSVQGDADDRGGMTATSLTLSDAVDGACARGGRGV